MSLLSSTHGILIQRADYVIAVTNSVENQKSFLEPCSLLQIL